MRIRTQFLYLMILLVTLIGCGSTYIRTDQLDGVRLGMSPNQLRDELGRPADRRLTLGTQRQHLALVYPMLAGSTEVLSPPQRYGRVADHDVKVSNQIARSEDYYFLFQKEQLACWGFLSEIAMHPDAEIRMLVDEITKTNAKNEARQETDEAREKHEKQESSQWSNL